MDTTPQIAPKHPALERHYTIAEVAKMWGLSHSSIYRLFAEIPGMLRHNGGARTSAKRAHVTMRIPEHLVIQTYEALTARDPDFFRRKTTGAAGSRKSSVAAASSRSL